MNDTARARTSQQDEGMMQRPMIVGLLYLLAIVTGLTAIVGVILAYAWRGDAAKDGWEDTHFTYLIRTFWIGLVFMILMGVLFIGGFASYAVTTEQSGTDGPGPGMVLLVLAAMLFSLLGTLWFLIRSVVSMVRAGRREPMPRPRTWLF